MNRDCAGYCNTQSTALSTQVINQSINQSISDFLEWPKLQKSLQGPLKWYRQQDCCSKNDLKWRLKDWNVEVETMCSSREFQIWVAATGKARLPTVDSLTGGTTSQLVPAERSARRPGTSAVEVNGPRYCGASPWRTLYISTAILNWIRSGTHSQCRLTVILRISKAHLKWVGFTLCVGRNAQIKTSSATVWNGCSDKFGCLRSNGR